MNIFTIVVTYNGSKWVEKCFGSLVNSTIKTKILAIDNGSTDDTCSLVSARFPQIEVIEMGKNLGFGQANNIGIRKALSDNADFVFLLNQDAWVEPATIEALINSFNKYTEYGILSPVHLNGTGNGIDKNFSYYLSPESTPDLYSDLFMNKLKDIYSTKFVNAAAWMISRKCFEIVGGFDPIFQHYGEDNDYGYRLDYHKFIIGVITTSKIYHDRPQTKNKDLFYDFSRRYIIELIALKNINYSFYYTIMRFIFNSCEFFFLAIFKFDKKSLKISILLFIKLIVNLPKIRKSRIQSKENKGAFIS